MSKAITHDHIGLLIVLKLTAPFSVEWECCSNPKRLKLSKTLFGVPLRSCNCSRFRVEEKQQIVIFDDFGAPEAETIKFIDL